MSTRSFRYSSFNLHTPKGRMFSGTDVDACKFLEAAGIYNSVQQKAIFGLVYDLKRFGLWSKMKAIYPFVGGTATTHKWNLKDPQDTDAAFRLTFSGGWTHSSTGALPNGTNAYANTHLNASTLVSSNAHQSFYSRTNANGLHFDIGASNIGSTQIISLYGRFSGNSLADIGNYLTSRISVAVANSLGLYVVSRTSTTSVKLYKAGAEIGSNTSTDTATLPNSTINLSAVLLQGYSQYSVRECAFATIGDGLTDAEASLLYQCVDRFQKTLGRAVATDADASAFITAAGITNYTQQQAIQKLVVDLKSFGLWTKMKAIYPFVGGTATTHKWNLKDPRDLDAAFRLTFSGGWTHSNTGALPNGTNAYANTYLNPSTTLTLFNAHLTYYGRRATLSPSASNIEIGNYVSSNDKLFCLVLPRSNGFATAVHTEQSSASYFATKGGYTNMNGLWLNNRRSSANADFQLWRNDVNEAQPTNTNLTGTFHNNRIFVGALNTAASATGESANFFSPCECAFASIGDGLTDTEAANLYNVVQRFQTDLGRQV